MWMSWKCQVLLRKKVSPNKVMMMRLAYHRAEFISIIQQKNQSNLNVKF